MARPTWRCRRRPTAAAISPDCPLVGNATWCRKFRIAVFNTGPGNFNGPIKVVDLPPPGATVSLHGAIGPWSCNAATKTCQTNGNVVLKPNDPTDILVFNAHVSGDDNVARALNCKVNNWARIIGPVGAPQNVQAADDQDHAAYDLPARLPAADEPADLQDCDARGLQRGRQQLALHLRRDGQEHGPGHSCRLGHGAGLAADPSSRRQHDVRTGLELQRCGQRLLLHHGLCPPDARPTGDAAGDRADPGRPLAVQAAEHGAHQGTARCAMEHQRRRRSGFGNGGFRADAGRRPGLLPHAGAAAVSAGLRVDRRPLRARTRARDADATRLPGRAMAEQGPLLPGGPGLDRPALRQAGQAGVPGRHGRHLAQLPRGGRAEEVSGRYDRHVAQLPQGGGAKKCPDGTTGTWPNCRKVEEPKKCPDGTTGKWPNCRKVEEPKKCPEGTIGKWPNCKRPEPAKCPKGMTGTPPNCKRVVPEKCPAGTVGKPPNCRKVVVKVHADAPHQPEAAFDASPALSKEIQRGREASLAFVWN